MIGGRAVIIGANRGRRRRVVVRASGREGRNIGITADHVYKKFLKDSAVYPDLEAQHVDFPNLYWPGHEEQRINEQPGGIIGLTEERHEILGAMLVFAPRQDFAGRDLERGEQVERAIPDVVLQPEDGAGEGPRA